MFVRFVMNGWKDYPFVVLFLYTKLKCELTRVVASVTHLSMPVGELPLKPQRSPMSQAPEHLGGNSVKYSLAN